MDSRDPGKGLSAGAWELRSAEEAGKAAHQTMVSIPCFSSQLMCVLERDDDDDDPEADANADDDDEDSCIKRIRFWRAWLLKCKGLRVVKCFQQGSAKPWTSN